MKPGFVFKINVKGRLHTGSTVEAVIKEAKGEAVEVFKVTTESIGWHKEKVSYEKVEAPPEVAKRESDKDGDEDDTYD